MKKVSLLFVLVLLLSVGCAKKQVLVANDQRPVDITEPSNPDEISEPNIRDRIIEQTNDLKTIYFEYDKSALSETARETLKDNSKWILAHPEYVILIQGHADERGTIEYNIALGQERATAVRKYLVYLGVKANKVATISFGKERPVDTTGTESGMAKNRRAETKFMK